MSSNERSIMLQNLKCLIHFSGHILHFFIVVNFIQIYFLITKIRKIKIVKLTKLTITKEHFGSHGNYFFKIIVTLNYPEQNVSKFRISN